MSSYEIDRNPAFPAHRTDVFNTKLVSIMMKGITDELILFSNVVLMIFPILPFDFETKIISFSGLVF